MPPINQKNVPLQSGAAGALGLGDRSPPRRKTKKKLQGSKLSKQTGKASCPAGSRASVPWVWEEPDMPIGMPTEAEVAALMAQLSPAATPTETTPPAAADPSAPSPINVRTIDATGPLGLSPFTDAQTAASISLSVSWGSMPRMRLI